MEAPTLYAKNGNVHLAYQVHGDGPRGLVYIPGLLSHVEFAWEEPSYSRFLRRLGSMARLILIDMRGVGLSDRAQAIPLLEEQMDDITAVLEASGSVRATIFLVFLRRTGGDVVCRHLSCPNGRVDPLRLILGG